MAGTKGNKNALKHGIFSKFIAVTEDKELAKMSNDKNLAEIAYARVRLAAAQTELNKAETTDDKLKWDYACRHWTEILGNLLKNNVDRGETEVMVFQNLLDAVRAANDKQNVQK